MTPALQGIPGINDPSRRAGAITMRLKPSIENSISWIELSNCVSVPDQKNKCRPVFT